MLELLFLLLPLAAAYGWYMGCRSVEQDKHKATNRLSKDCVARMDFLLDNPQDKSIDFFLEMLKEETNALEVYLMLGNLFRSRGEVDRAIRIHQAMIESTALTLNQRLLAIQQLGCDYMAAGFYDRAENMFSQLLNEDDFRFSTLNLLLKIHQSTSEWLKAIDVANKLVKLGKAQCLAEIAHFYCELALQALGRDDMNRAVLFLKKGGDVDKNSPRVSIIRARIYMMQQDYAAAVYELTRVLDQDREMVSETLPMLQTCYQILDEPSAWAAFLRRCVEKNGSALAELLLTDVVEREEGAKVARTYLNQQLRQNPTMRMFYRLINFYLIEAEGGLIKESLQMLYNIIGQQIYTKPRYHCQKCGFTSQRIYWNCPSCKSWSSIKPIRGLDGQ
ncbi:lipopolysaccharide assembly protein LapB [Candidatus Steffania adelgidicola]|uniref:lipopolysaccharide assembly protein LapB n=1 Tax=Candidatus Steffania adelgidicola TaxID=1076626 RepID=UPI001D004F4E|nr:lipopolysaccharide assembly protein LapB [Candidatus Steffania adelgidicola]UDG80178.1 Lipopolysaccharide assembly protein B [Candidatus Steffania adelgidicola]